VTKKKRSPARAVEAPPKKGQRSLLTREELSIELAIEADHDTARYGSPYHLEAWTPEETPVLHGAIAVAGRVPAAGAPWDRLVRRLGVAAAGVEAARKLPSPSRRECLSEAALLAFVLDEQSREEDASASAHIASCAQQCAPAFVRIDALVEAVVRARAFFQHVEAGCEKCLTAIDDSPRPAERLAALGRAAQMPVQLSECLTEEMVARFCLGALEPTTAARLARHAGVCGDCAGRIARVADCAEEVVSAWTAASAARTRRRLEALLGEDIGVTAKHLAPLEEQTSGSTLANVERMLARAGEEPQRPSDAADIVAAGQWFFVTGHADALYVSVEEDLVRNRRDLALDVLAADGTPRFRAPLLSGSPARFAIPCSVVDALTHDGLVLRVVLAAEADGESG
jgi:hypothetical protein